MNELTISPSSLLGQLEIAESVNEMSAKKLVMPTQLVMNNLKELSEVLSSDAVLTKDSKIYKCYRLSTTIGYKPDLEVFNTTFLIAKEVFYGINKDVNFSSEEAVEVHVLYEKAIRGLERIRDYYSADQQFSEKMKNIISSSRPDEYNGIPTSVAIENLKVLAKFPEGIKPLMDMESQTIGIDNRYLITRTLQNGFDIGVLEKSIEKAVTILKFAAHGCERVKNQAEEIEKIYEDSRAGVRKIAQTFENENDAKVALEILKLLVTHTRKSFTISAPIPIPVRPSGNLEQKRKIVQNALSKPIKIRRRCQQDSGQPMHGQEPYDLGVTQEQIRQTKLKPVVKNSEEKKKSSPSEFLSEFRKRQSRFQIPLGDSKESQLPKEKLAPSNEVHAPLRHHRFGAPKEAVATVTRKTLNLFRRNKKMDESAVELSSAQLRKKIFEQKSRPASIVDVFSGSPVLEKPCLGISPTSSSSDELEGEWLLTNPYDSDEYAVEPPPVYTSFNQSKPVLIRQQSAILPKNPGDFDDLKKQLRNRRLSMEGKIIPRGDNEK